MWTPTAHTKGYIVSFTRGTPTAHTKGYIVSFTRDKWEEKVLYFFKEPIENK